MPLGDSVHKTEFQLPFQPVIAIALIAIGGILLAKRFNYLNFNLINDETMILIAAGGCVLGGLYMILDSIIKPRVYL